MANKSQGTWYVAFEQQTRKRGDTRARATETFPNEREAKKFARAKLVETQKVSAGTLNPHLPKRTICLNGSENRMKTIWLEQAASRKNHHWGRRKLARDR